MTEHYKIKPDGFKEIRKQILAKSIPLGVVALIVGLGIPSFNSNNQTDQASVLPIVIPICLGALAFGLYKGVNRQKKLFQSYVLTITENEIIREQSNTPSINISHSDITSISKNANGSFKIKGKSAQDVIGVAAQIDNYEQLERSLSQIRILEIKSKSSFEQKLIFPLALATLGLMATVYLATNKIIVGLSGAIMVGLLSWSFIQIQRNKNIDIKTKRGSYWIILVLFSIIAVTITKLVVK
jgi:hypothetical protein